MSAFNKFYEKQERNISFVDYEITKDDVRIDESLFEEIGDLFTLQRQSTAKTDNLNSEANNEEKYWLEEDEKMFRLIDKAMQQNPNSKFNEDPKEYWEIYKAIPYKFYNEMRVGLDSEGETYKERKKKQIEDRKKMALEMTRNPKYNFAPTLEFDRATLMEKRLQAVEYIDNLIMSNAIPDNQIRTKRDVHDLVVKEVEELEKLKSWRYSNASTTGSIVGGLSGGVVGSMQDPATLALTLIPIGRVASSLSLSAKIMSRAGREFAVGSAGEAVIQFTDVMEYKKDYLGQDYTMINALQSITFAGAGSAVFGGTLEGVSGVYKNIRYGKTDDGIGTDTFKETAQEIRRLEREGVIELDADEIEAVKVLETNSTIAQTMKEGSEDLIEGHYRAVMDSVKDAGQGRTSNVDAHTSDIRNRELNDFIDGKTTSEQKLDFEGKPVKEKPEDKVFNKFLAKNKKEIKEDINAGLTNREIVNKYNDRFVKENESFLKDRIDAKRNELFDKNQKIDKNYNKIIKDSDTVSTPSKKVNKKLEDEYGKENMEENLDAIRNRDEILSREDFEIELEDGSKISARENVIQNKKEQKEIEDLIICTSGR